MISGKQLIDDLSRPLFWDIEKASVDHEKHDAFIIARVMERGTREDVRLVWDFYGELRIKEVLLAAPSLSRKTIAFFANQFSIDRECFRAHQRSTNWVQ